MRSDNHQSIIKTDATIQRQIQINTLNADIMNLPKRQPFSFHIIALLAGVLQVFILVYFSKAGFSQFLSLIFEKDKESQSQQSSQKDIIWGFIISTIVYLFVVAISYFSNDFQAYFKNVKNVKQLNACYEKIRKSGVSLIFQSESYHNQEYHDNRNSKKKVVTHTAKKIITFSQCYDASGFMKPNIQKQFQKKFSLINYQASYEFLEKQQEKILDQMYLNFVAQNNRDTHQDHKRLFKFSDCQSSTKQAYLLQGQKTELNTLLLIASLFCLAWPVSLLIEYLYVKRYEVKVVKKIKLDEKQQGYKKIA